MEQLEREVETLRAEVETFSSKNAALSHEIKKKGDVARKMLSERDEEIQLLKAQLAQLRAAGSVEHSSPAVTDTNSSSRSSPVHDSSHETGPGPQSQQELATAQPEKAVEPVSLDDILSAAEVRPGSSLIRPCG